MGKFEASIKSSPYSSMWPSVSHRKETIVTITTADRKAKCPLAPHQHSATVHLERSLHPLGRCCYLRYWVGRLGWQAADVGARGRSCHSGRGCSLQLSAAPTEREPWGGPRAQERQSLGGLAEGVWCLGRCFTPLFCLGWVRTPRCSVFEVKRRYGGIRSHFG